MDSAPKSPAKPVDKADDLAATRTRVDVSEIRQKLEGQKGKQYWRSLEELAETPEFEEFVYKEFPRQAAPLENSVDRRDFMKLLGASLALAGLTSCVRPYQQERIVPAVTAAEEALPGEPLHFATAMTQAGYATGALAQSIEGRPTKLDGNPDHPMSLGSSTAQLQAATLALYDPDRSANVIKDGAVSNFEEFAKALAQAVKKLGKGGKGLYLLSENVTSPTLSAQIGELLAAHPDAVWHQYDGLHNNVLAGSEIAFKKPLQPHYDFTKADVILSLGADFLTSGPAQVRYSRDFASRRRVHKAEDAKTMNRLYVAESSPSATGTMADHRLALSTSEQILLAWAVAGAVGLKGAKKDALLPHRVPQAWFDALVEDLNAGKKRALVACGDEQPAALHALVHLINEHLGALGTTVHFTQSALTRPLDQIASLQDLVKAMNSGDAKVLLIMGGNPAYTAPADLQFAAALKKVPFSANLSLYRDETATLVNWHIPQTHELETWSDARAVDGTATIMQPLIEPFYDGLSAHQFLDAVKGKFDTKAFDLVRATYESAAQGGNFDAFWRESVYKGTVAGTAFKPEKGIAAQADSYFESQAYALQADALAAEAAAGELELLIRPDPNVLDGRYSNLGWLQELPKPFTKLTWDNAAYISPKLASDRGLSSGDVVRLKANGESIEIPVWVMPGQAENVILVHLGYGRKNAGHVGNGVGVDITPLRSSQNMWYVRGAELDTTGKRYTLASTQMHHSLDQKDVSDRHIVRAGTAAELLDNPEHPHFVHPVEHPESDLYKDFEYTGHAWGMVVDMNVCTGCNACVTACQSENNIPIVGKDQIAVGREMHWIRVDGYYQGGMDAPTFYHMPMMCQHCEKAPCEPVCPVGATVHDSEGLNVMVYNRCVGTRYCSNNCPYKVRRFNYLQYAELTTNSLAMLQNPNVTVRSRGVMEKCTYCVQRIKHAQITARNEARDLKDGDVITACQSACPTEAIVFGDINDKTSAVSQTKASVLNYGVLTELNTYPRTTYLAKLSNPNPSLAEGSAHAEAQQTGAHE